MAKSTQKTKETEKSVSAFIKKTCNAERAADAKAILDIMQQQSGFGPRMWGPSIIGFGSYHYKYASGHEGDAPLIGFSPRKNEFALYIMNFEGKEQLLKSLGKHKAAKACVYIKKTEDIDTGVLKKLIAGSINYVKATYK